LFPLNKNLLSFSRSYFFKNSYAKNLPLEVSLELTNICNFHCIFCPQSTGEHLDRIGRHTLSLDNAEYILYKIRQLGYNRKLIHWTLDGEPFINKAFSHIFQAAKKYDFTVQRFSTNGYFLSSDVVDKLPPGIEYILSIDFCSDKEYFEYTRGTPGSWEVIKNNILNILQKDYPNIHLVLNDISEFGDYTKEELDTLHNNLQSLFPESPRITYRTRKFHNAAGFLNKNVRNKSSKYHLCPYPWSSLYIASNGDVVACCRDLEHKSVLGNVFQEEDLASIWNGQDMLKLRENLINAEPHKNHACKECDLPWDSSKFSLSNILHAISNRLEFKR